MAEDAHGKHVWWLRLYSVYAVCAALLFIVTWARWGGAGEACEGGFGADASGV